MREAYGFSEGICPVAEDFASRTLALPFYPQLEADDQERVVEVLRSALVALWTHRHRPGAVPTHTCAPRAG